MLFSVSPMTDSQLNLSFILKHFRSLPTLLVLGLILVSCGSSTEPEPKQEPEEDLINNIDLPEGFTVDLFAENLNLPTSIAFPPDGSNRMFVNELQSGKIWIYKDGEKLSEPFAEVNTDVTGGFPVDGENGLLGLAFDPDYESNGYVYITYATRTDTGEVGTVARFTDNNNNGENYTELLTGLPSAKGHQIENLTFGPNEHLYVSIGDAYVDTGAQNLDTFHGKIIRMTRNGEVPDDNPFVDNPEVGNKYIYAYGFRNAYDLVFRENGELLTTDNGPNQNDEFNTVLPGKNYAWPNMMGYSGSGTDFADPAHVWQQITSPTGMQIYQGTQFPEKYHGKLFQVLFDRTHTSEFGDDTKAKRVQVVHLNGEGLETQTDFEDFAVFRFGNKINNPLDVTEGPDGSLYVSDIFQGKVFRIRYDP